MFCPASTNRVYLPDQKIPTTPLSSALSSHRPIAWFLKFAGIFAAAILDR
jgi:hypothetical protein